MARRRGLRLAPPHRPGFELHRAVAMRYRGKADSVYIDCECGATDIAAVWWDKPPAGWDREQWPKLREAIVIYLASFDAARDTSEPS